MRIVIGGGPRTGKTTLARKLGWPIRSTDDLTGQLDWSGVSQLVADEWLTAPGPWVIEGVATVRALRKLLKIEGSVMPDVLIWLTRPFVAQTLAQRRMSKGCETVLASIGSQVHARGIKVVRRNEVWDEDLIERFSAPRVDRFG